MTSSIAYFLKMQMVKKLIVLISDDFKKFGKSTTSFSQTLLKVGASFKKQNYCSY